jgi:hypothetical protein
MIPACAVASRFKIRGSAVDNRSAAVADSNPTDIRRIGVPGEILINVTLSLIGVLLAKGHESTISINFR